jgi:hypothetical protein
MYYRMNFGALTFGEIFRASPAAVLVLFPIVWPLWLFLKLSGIRMMMGAPMPDQLELSLVGPDDPIRRQLGLSEFQDTVAALGFEPLGLYVIENFSSPCYLMGTIDPTRQVYGVWYFAVIQRQIRTWLDMVTKFKDGQSLTTSTSSSVGAIRHRPEAHYRRRKGLDARSLYELHLQDARNFREPVRRDPKNFVEDFREGWRKSVSYYVETGLYLPITENDPN